MSPSSTQRTTSNGAYDPVTANARSGALSIGGVSLKTLARRFGTPLYVYDHKCFMARYAAVAKAFAPVKPLLAFSMKCNSNTAILRSLIGAGAGLDIVSGGELVRGLAAGVNPGHVIFAGVGKTRRELEAALDVGILAFNVESEAEAEALAAAGRRMRRPAPVCLRVNPDVDPDTHHYITTGRKENKFGIPYENVRRLARRLAGMRGLELIGIHTHIGSQILKPAGYVEALERVHDLIEALRGDGHAIDIYNMGGGFGIAYEHGQRQMNVGALARELMPGLRELGCRLIFEPGRYIMGPAGFLLTRVEYIKSGHARDFAIVDGAMNDLMRPSLYGAHHRIQPDSPRGRKRSRTYDIVGPICESGDFLGKQRHLPTLEAGDLLLVRDAGAYGMAMSSNYNSRPRPAEVMIHGRQAHLIRRRETIDDLVSHEIVPKFLA